VNGSFFVLLLVLGFSSHFEEEDKNEEDCCNFVKFLNLILFGKGAAMIRAIDMKPIMVIYPGFQTLPKGLKQLLVESESFFFEEETTFFRRNPKRVAALLTNNEFRAVRQPLSKSWKN